MDEETKNVPPKVESDAAEKAAQEATAKEAKEKAKAEKAAGAAAAKAAKEKAAQDAAEKAKAEAGKIAGSLVRVGRDLLKSHPGRQTIYMTTDGSGFFARNDAENHARTLADKTVTPVNAE